MKLQNYALSVQTLPVRGGFQELMAFAASDCVARGWGALRPRLKLARMPNASAKGRALR